MTTTVVNNSVFKTFFEKEKLTGPNFIDWYRNLQIVLSVEDKLTYLEHLIPAIPVPSPGQEFPPDVLAAHTTWVKASNEIVGLMLMTMVPEIQKNLEQLGACDMLKELKTLFSQHFVQNYNMHDMGKTVNELHAMLKLHEQPLLKKGTTKLAYAPTYAHKPKILPPPKKDNHAKDAICHQCCEAELYYVPSKSWVYDTGCGTHICNTTQGLKGSKKLKPRALNLYVGNGHRAAVEAIRTFHLCLPSGLVVVLNNCHFAPSITIGIISVSRLDGIYEIDLHDSNANNSSMYVVSNKRAKLILDSTLLWHCHLGHISKKRIDKLQHDGLLNSTGLQSFDKYVSCLSRKMARKPYSHQVERAKDLLELIHTDVCGPFRTVLRQGASYFVTFTNDFSRYDYVYLLKHKHKVFETFKVFQKEEENQLGKIINSICSDRGGEYMSQEFLDHLKEHGIIAHRTPPYTPQHNGVSERRNRTMLNMVRSMMSQTNLPKSFWDYVLESAARILNMVPTKKVEKTPYEVWHGQAPKMSYLKVWGCEVLVKCDTLTKPDKLEPRSIKCIFIGYPKKHWVTPSTTHLRTRSYVLYVDAEEHELGDLNEPAEYKAALLDLESDKWLATMNVEMQSMKDNQVMDLVDLPLNGKTVGSKWLFKKKTDIDGNVHTYKARPVAKGFMQTYEVDYEETFSPIADIRAIRILITIDAFYDYEI
ncbi:retrotransposon protein, putative, ty1-copia subclass [Tanacetum coccineum]